MTNETKLSAENEVQAESLSPYRVWHMVTTFRKDGTPVMGSLGSRAEEVIVMRTATFKRLIAEHPSLASAQFEVGE